MRRISLKGVLIGGVVDVALSNFAAFPILIFAAIRMELWKLPSAQQAPALVSALTNDLGIVITGIVAGSLCSIVGGYVAAHIAGREAMLNGAVSAWLCIPFGLSAALARKGPLPLWIHLLLLLMSPVSALWAGTSGTEEAVG